MASSGPGVRCTKPTAVRAGARGGDVERRRRGARRLRSAQASTTSAASGAWTDGREGRSERRCENAPRLTQSALLQAVERGLGLGVLGQQVGEGTPDRVARRGPSRSESRSSVRRHSTQSRDIASSRPITALSMATTLIVATPPSCR